MLVLIVLLSCLVSILMITLLNIEKMNTQLIVFLSVLVGLMLFKIVFDLLIKKNKTNPLSKNMVSNVNLENQSVVNEVLPSNFNKEINNDHPFVNNNNNNVANNTVADNNVANNKLANNNNVANNNVADQQCSQ